MKIKVTIKIVGKRFKAFEEGKEKPIKTVPIPFEPIVAQLGFIDIRSNKMTMTGEERLLLYLYSETQDKSDYFKGLDNIEVQSKQFVKTRSGDDYYSVIIKGGLEIKIKQSMYNKLELEERKVKRWA